MALVPRDIFLQASHQLFVVHPTARVMGKWGELEVRGEATSVPAPSQEGAQGGGVFGEPVPLEPGLTAVSGRNAGGAAFCLQLPVDFNQLRYDAPHGPSLPPAPQTSHCQHALLANADL